MQRQQKNEEEEETAKDTQGIKAIIDFNSFTMRLATFKGFLRLSFSNDDDFPPLNLVRPYCKELMYCDLSTRKGNNLYLFIELPRRRREHTRERQPEIALRWQTFNSYHFSIILIQFSAMREKNYWRESAINFYIFLSDCVKNINKIEREEKRSEVM